MILYRDFRLAVAVAATALLAACAPLPPTEQYGVRQQGSFPMEMSRIPAPDAAAATR